MGLACGQLVETFGEHAERFVLRPVYIRHEQAHRPAGDGHLGQEPAVPPEHVEHVTDDGHVELGGNER